MAENLFTVYFDGGDSREYAYGSWMIKFNGFTKKVMRFKVEPIEQRYLKNGVFILRATNNVAEYMSLIKALEWLQSVKDKELYKVNIYGDSRLVINQVNGIYKCRKQHLAPFINRCRELLKGFKDWKTMWHRRNNSVAIFGH